MTNLIQVYLDDMLQAFYEHGWALPYPFIYEEMITEVAMELSRINGPHYFGIVELKFDDYLISLEVNEEDVFQNKRLVIKKDEKLLKMELLPYKLLKTNIVDVLINFASNYLPVQNCKVIHDSVVKGFNTEGELLL